MQRLTKRNPDGAANFADADFERVCAELAPENREKVRAIVDALAEWEDADEQGRLVTLPVKIGQKVYVIVNLSVGIAPWIEETTVCALTFKDSHYPRCVWSFSTKTTEPFHKSDIGKSVFLTRAEAEAALKGGGV